MHNPSAPMSNQQTAHSSSEPHSQWKPLRPNVLITGTPGVGKTTLSRHLAEQLGLRHINVGDFAKERNLLADHDAQHDAFYMHEDAVLDELEPILADGGIILDHHSCDWYPERWFHIVVVLRTSTEALFDRLESRQYSKQKLDENLQAEIMQVVLEEAVESYPRIKVMELKNDSEQQKELNIRSISQAWRHLTRHWMNPSSTSPALNNDSELEPTALR